MYMYIYMYVYVCVYKSINKICCLSRWH